MQSRLMFFICVVSCRVAKEGSSKLQDKWSDFLDEYPTVEELEGDEAFGTIRSQVTICCGMNAAPPQPPPPGGGPGAAAAAGASVGECHDLGVESSVKPLVWG